MEINVEVWFNPSFYKKLDQRALQRSHEQLIEKLCHDIEKECRIQAPVRTGNLRDSHYTIIDGLESYVGNSAEYVNIVRFGARNTVPNDYVTRAIFNEMKELRYNNIDYNYRSMAVLRPADITRLLLSILATLVSARRQAIFNPGSGINSPAWGTPGKSPAPTNRLNGPSGSSQYCIFRK